MMNVSAVSFEAISSAQGNLSVSAESLGIDAGMFQKMVAEALVQKGLSLGGNSEEEETQSMDLQSIIMQMLLGGNAEVTATEENQQEGNLLDMLLGGETEEQTAVQGLIAAMDGEENALNANQTGAETSQTAGEELLNSLVTGAANTEANADAQQQSFAEENALLGSLTDKTEQTDSQEKFDITEAATQAADDLAGATKVSAEQNADVSSHRSDIAAVGNTETEFRPNATHEGAKMEPYSQVGKEIETMLAKKGPMQFSMQLNPADLGKIDVNMSFDKGQLTIDIVAANAKTQELLTGQVDKLVGYLGLQNVQVENIHVSQQPSMQQQSYADPNMSFFMNLAHRGQKEEQGNDESQKNSSVGGQTIAGEEIQSAMSGTDPREMFQRMSYRI